MMENIKFNKFGMKLNLVLLKKIPKALLYHFQEYSTGKEYLAKNNFDFTRGLVCMKSENDKSLLLKIHSSIVPWWGKILKKKKINWLWCNKFNYKFRFGGE